MIYEYRCTLCGRLIVAVRKIEERDYPIDLGNIEGCLFNFMNVIVSPPSIPFEHLRDQGMFDRVTDKLNYKELN